MSSDPSAVAGVRAPTAIEQVRQRIEAAAVERENQADMAWAERVCGGNGWPHAVFETLRLRDALHVPLAAALLAVLDLADEADEPYSKYNSLLQTSELRAAVVAAFQPKEDA